MRISRLCGRHEPSRPIQELDQNLLKRHKQQAASSQHARLTHKVTRAISAMASLAGFGTVAPAVASSPTRSHVGRRAARPSSSAHVPAATKSVGAAAKAEEQKGLFDIIFGPMFKEDQLLETDPVLSKVQGKAPAPRKAADGGGLSLGGFFSKKEST
jgi:hypothetical protein